MVELPQQSVMIQSRVMMSGQFGARLVVVLPMTIVGATVQQSSNAVGGVNVHGVPQLTVILEAQTTFGGSVSMMSNLWVQMSEVLVQQSVAVHCKSNVLKQTDVKLVVTLMRLNVTFVPQHASNAVG